MDQDLAQRLKLQTLLETVLGSRNVYFQPPNTLKMNYPCIRYSRGNVSEMFADNQLYLYKKNYQIIVIDANPDSEIPKKISELPLCSFSRHYTVDNLNHDVFNIYY